MFRKYSEKGFTLVEMMVVVAIIAILAGAFLIGLRGFRSSAYDARRLSDLQKVQGYIELYYNKNGTYPDANSWTTLEGLLTSSVGIKSIPHDPQSSHSDYKYDHSTDLQSYMVEAELSDPKNKIFTGDYENNPPTPFGNGDIQSCAPPHYCLQF